MSYLCFSVSNSVSQRKWTKVYEEALALADKLELADWDKFYYKGVRSYAYCKVKEYTKEYDGEPSRFWKACGDYHYITDGEYFRLDRKIDYYDKNAGPGILGDIDSYIDIDSDTFEKQTSGRSMKIWGGSYFLRLLALLCFMESKLKDKIFIYGNFNRQNCESAVELVNKYLKEPIELPARCDPERLYGIVRTIDISDVDKIDLMENAYLGDIDLDLKKCIVENFDKRTINKFWKKRFKNYTIEDYQFKGSLKAYLSYGFDFKDLFSYISLNNEKEEYIKFLELIFDIEKNSDSLSRSIGFTRDPKDNKIRGFSIGFRCSIFGPEAEATFPYKYYVFDDYVNELSKYFGSYIDVRNFLKEKIKDQDEDSFILSLKKYCRDAGYYSVGKSEKYDIKYASDLMYYKPGDKITPYLMKEIKAWIKINKKRLNDIEFKEISQKETTEQIYELIDFNHQFPARDIDWHHAIDYFNSHSDALERYYPLFRMQFELFTPAEAIAKALFINDEFYEFCKGV